MQLQKSLFLLGHRRSEEVGEAFYEFRPYHYGPFDQQVYYDAEQLAGEGLVEVDITQGRSLRRYVLTSCGFAAAEDAARAFPYRAVAYLGAVVPWAQRLSFNELVRAIYDAYPDMRANSVFRDAE